ncbi:MAG: hypothetical protein VW551_07805 [Euryarchaeota archaeon]
MNSADERVWELLQTIDLENLDIATFQGVAAPIFAQKENKEALEALALIAFARMARQGEFNGWLNAGGGGTSVYGAAPIERFTGAAGDLNMFIPASAYGGGSIFSGASYPVGMYLYPFMASDNATIDAFQIYANNTDGTASLFGVYNSLDNGLPDALQVSCSITTSSTGVLTQTTLTGSLTMTKGETYWMAMIVDNATQDIAGYRFTDAQGLSPLPQTVVATGYSEILLYDATPTSLPATFTASDFDPVSTYVPIVGLRLA